MSTNRNFSAAGNDVETAARMWVAEQKENVNYDILIDLIPNAKISEVRDPSLQFSRGSIQMEPIDFSVYAIGIGTARLSKWLETNYFILVFIFDAG
jgi:hypothetical protein